MRVRIPDKNILPPEKFEAKTNRRTFVFNLRTITPIYGGGVSPGEPDMYLPVRATSIRGQLRHWWRFLASHCNSHPLSGTQLYQAEQYIWGGMAQSNDEHQDADFSSKVSIKVDCNNSQNNINRILCSTFIENQSKQHQPALRYALFSAMQNKEYVIAPGVSFTLIITAISETLTDNQWQSVYQAIRWWANFGGIGARTRRGLGSVEFIDNTITPVSNEEANKYGCTLQPTRNTSSDAIVAWNKSFEKLQKFRQGEHIGRRPGRDQKQKKKLGRSYWPEPDSIREITDSHAKEHSPEHEARIAFPRAAFGLPIIFEFKSDNNIPGKTELLPEESTRLASPLILKALPVGGRYQSVALLLPTELKTLSIKLKYSGVKDTLKGMKRDEWWPVDPLKAKQKADHIDPMKNRDPDPLMAFMKYFGE